MFRHKRKYSWHGPQFMGMNPCWRSWSLPFPQDDLIAELLHQCAGSREAALMGRCTMAVRRPREEEAIKGLGILYCIISWSYSLPQATGFHTKPCTCVLKTACTCVQCNMWTSLGDIRSCSITLYKSVSTDNALDQPIVFSLCIPSFSDCSTSARQLHEPTGSSWELKGNIDTLHWTKAKPSVSQNKIRVCAFECKY